MLSPGAIQLFGITISGKEAPTEKEIQKEIEKDLSSLRDRLRDEKADPDKLIAELQGDIREKRDLERKFEPKTDLGE